MILMSLNGIKLVVTRLASPARIGLQRLFLAGICERIRVPKPCDFCHGAFVHLAPDNQKHFPFDNPQRSPQKQVYLRRGSVISPFLEVDCVHAGRAYAVFPGSRLFFARLYIVLTVITVICRIRMLVQAIRYRLPASRPFGFSLSHRMPRQTPSDDSLANRNSAGRSFCSTILLSFSGRSYVAFRRRLFC